MSKSIITQAFASLRNQKLTQDIAFTMGSFVVLAISGIVINIIVTAFRDAAALGVFNLAYAVYIVMSQLAVWGIHYSVLRHAAYYIDSPNERSCMLFTAGVCTFLLGILAATIMTFAQPIFIQIFDSERAGQAIFYAAIGLSIFPLNKVLLAYLNGLREMKAFSFLQGLRYILVMLLVSVVALSSWPIEYATLSFFIAELITALSASFYILIRGLAPSLRFSWSWVAKHFRFGTKGLMSGTFAEVNSRVDVLLIGFFLSDRLTGIYSFAAMLVDGLYHVLAMIRINFNPMLVASVRDADWKQALNLRKLSNKYVMPAVVILSAILILAYWLFASWVLPDKGLMEGFPSLLILLLGLNIVAIFVPFDNLMMVSGHPGYQTIQHLTMVAANVVIAVLLLPLLGINGAAIGTAIGYVCGITMLLFFSKKILGWNIFTNTIRNVQ